MLTKEICMRCVNRSKRHGKWNQSDVDVWERGGVICAGPPEHHGKYQSTDHKKAPPEWCYHAFEHYVAAGMSDAK